MHYARPSNAGVLKRQTIAQALKISLSSLFFFSWRCDVKQKDREAVCKCFNLNYATKTFFCLCLFFYNLVLLQPVFNACLLVPSTYSRLTNHHSKHAQTCISRVIPSLQHFGLCISHAGVARFAQGLSFHGQCSLSACRTYCTTQSGAECTAHSTSRTYITWFLSPLHALAAQMVCAVTQ